MRVICISNHKGGCSKTTVALNLAVTLSATGSRVLTVDLDPQGNLSASLGIDLEDLENTKRTAHRLMLDEQGDYSNYVVNMRPRLDMIPACLDADAEQKLSYSIAQPASSPIIKHDHNDHKRSNHHQRPQGPQ